MRPIHPALARVLVAYVQLADAVDAGIISEDEAHLRAEELAAKDDQGVWWRIDSSDGEWYRQLADGNWVRQQPPEYGIPVVTPYEVSVPVLGPAAMPNPVTVTTFEQQPQPSSFQTAPSQTSPPVKPKAPLDWRLVAIAVVIGLIAATWAYRYM